MLKTFNFKYVVSTLRESYSATHNGWKALIYNGKDFYESKRYDINPIIDRVGGGDSFAGGLIHGRFVKRECLFREHHVLNKRLKLQLFARW